MKTTLLIVPAFLLAVIVAVAGAGNVPKDLEKHTNQDRTVEEIQALAIVYEELRALSDWGFLDPTVTEMYALASDLGTDCADRARNLCGEGNICCFCVWAQNGVQQCSFSCRQGDGNCQPCPHCGPRAMVY